MLAPFIGLTSSLCATKNMAWYVLRPSVPPLAMQWQCNSVWVVNGHNLLDCVDKSQAVGLQKGALHSHHAFDAGAHYGFVLCIYYFIP